MYSVIEKYTRALKHFRDDGISVPVLPSEMRQLISEFLALKEHCAALESREVCTVAHEDVETCGYCQRDALAARLAEAERNARRYEKVRPLNVPQFKALFDRNIALGEPFDSLVDQIPPPEPQEPVE